MTEIYFAYITTSNVEEATRIGRTLVEGRLAACVNILPNMQSLYWWQEKIQSDNECVLLAKTSAEHCQALVEQVKKLHSYQCPCIALLPVTGGNPNYLQWIIDETKPSTATAG